MPKSRKRKTIKNHVQAIPVQVKQVVGHHKKTGEPILAVYKAKRFRFIKHK